jgi:PAS domain S-box-containing protein
MPPGWKPLALLSRHGPGTLAMHWLAWLRGSQLGLRTHLVAFGLAIVVPVLAYSGYLLHRFIEAERQAYERRALGTARALGADIDREITAIITTLQTLATSRGLVTGDFAGFHAQAAEALALRPAWNVVLLDSAGKQLVNTRQKWGDPLPTGATAEPKLPGIVQQTKRPYVSDLFTGALVKRSIFAVAVPVRVGNAVPYALVMSLDPTLLAEILNSADLPERWIAGMADRNNLVMARSVNPEQAIGQPLSEDTVRRSKGLAEGVIVSTDAAGQPILLAFHVSKLTGWRTAAWAPIHVVEAPLRRAWTLFLLSGTALLGLSLLLALGLGRLMAQPIARLTSAGADLGHGRPVVPISSTLREADELSQVLTNAARELEARMGAQAQLAAIVSSSPNAMVGLSPDGIVETWNAAAARLFGYEAGEVIGKSVRMFYPEGTAGEFEALNASVRSGEIVHQDVLRRHKDGRLLDVSISVAPMYSERGHLVGVSAIVRDISERKARERHIEFLMRELSHRSKNLLAVVQAIAGQTARHSESVDEFRSTFVDRLHAMARSQDLLVANNWQGVRISDLVRSQLAPFADEESGRIALGGPELQLQANAVQGLALALHELATNASKYGALSVPDGRIAIAWELGPANGEGRHFRMSWRESNGPPVSPPSRRGFGHVVIEEMVARSLQGTVELDYAPAGLSWTLDIPSAGVLSPVEGEPG